MLTADTITDEQIREIDPFYLDSQTRCDALGLPRGPYEDALQPGDVRAARARCAEILNARAARREAPAPIK